MKYICTICGFIYDESLGYDNNNIPAGTAWSDVPSEWKCPLCGATKNEFKLVDEESSESRSDIADDVPVVLPSEINYTSAELSAIFSNLAKGWEKQYQPETAALCNQLSTFYKAHATSSPDNNLAIISTKNNEDLTTGFSAANQIAGKYADRGALRALKWAEQVSRMLGSHLKRFESEGPAFIETTNVYVCEICGFIYISDEKPDICPVCKVPNMKMTKIERGA